MKDLVAALPAIWIKLPLYHVWTQHQVILLQDNDPYNLTVVNVRPGEEQTVHIVPGGRYCVMELPMGDTFHSESRYAREFIAEEDADTTTPHVVDRNIITSKTCVGEK